MKSLYVCCKKNWFFFTLVFIVATAVRTILFVEHPGGLNPDEASIGYEAWSLLHYGVDRNGFSWPVHLVAWGSGQNVLYAYLSMPFIALFGLNVFSVRIVNLLFSLLSVGAVYVLVRRIASEKAAKIAMALTAAAPWNIMLARWGLESNIYPAFLLFGLMFLALALEKPRYLYACAAAFGLSLYAYGSAYVVTTILCGVCFLYALIKKLLPLKTLLLAAALYFVIAFPIYLFMIVNIFELETITLFGVISVPRLPYWRFNSLTEGLRPSIILENLCNMLVLQNDGALRNAIVFSGCFYVISLPFWLLGLFTAVRDRRPGMFFLKAAFLSALLLFAFYYEPNINRVNAVYFPLIVLTALGIAEIADKKFLWTTLASYLLCFALFCSQYFSEDTRYRIEREFQWGFLEALQAAETVAEDGALPVYIVEDDDMRMPYIYVLFINQIPPQEYLATRKIQNETVSHQKIESFGNYVFDVSSFDRRAPGVYVLKDRKAAELEEDASVFFVTEYARFSVVVVAP